MSHFLIVGAGAVGTGVASELVERGHEVTIATRHGSGREILGATHVALDVSDLDATARLAHGVRAIFNCANPKYHRWPTDWPPMANSLLHAATMNGATLVTTANLYVYGVPHGLMTPHDPLNATYDKARVRVDMWNNALAAHQAGRVNVVEVRASDFIGANTNTLFAERVIPKILKGRSVQVLGSPEAVHSWTYVPDLARTLVAVALDSSTWGRAWHAPTNLARSQRDVVNELCDTAGVGHVEVTSISKALIRIGGVFSPMIRELPKTIYQFEGPFIIEDSDTREKLGLTPTPWHDVLVNTLSPFVPTRESVTV